MNEDLAQPAETIPDLPADLADPEPGPPVLLIPVQPASFGFPRTVVAGIYLLDLVVVVLLALAVRRLWRATRPRPVAPALPAPRAEALASLDGMRASLESISLRDLAIGVSATIRRFADREYGIGLTTRTAEEFRGILSAQPDLLPGTLSRDLLAYLERCDDVKFKPSADSAEARTRLWEDAANLVRQAPLPVPRETQAA